METTDPRITPTLPDPDDETRSRYGFDTLSVRYYKKMRATVVRATRIAGRMEHVVQREISDAIVRHSRIPPDRLLDLVLEQCAAELAKAANLPCRT
jgi:hypothetical protein